MIRAASPAVDLAARVLGERATRNAPLGPLTTYRVGGPAALLCVAHELADLRAVADAVQVSGIEVLVIGRGSNLLVSDDGFAGLVVQVGELGAAITIDGTSVLAGAAVALPVLARRTAAAGLTGFEWAVGVPGSVGGAVRMNAGGHGSDMASCLSTVHLFDLRSGEHGEVPAEQLHLRFRGSDLADHQVVVEATLRLAPGDAAASEAMLTEIVRWRREHQPGGQNAGSVFVNPVPGQLSAGEVIDGLGLRGLRIGSAEVSPKHANFVQADEGGRASDVRAVMEAVRQRVLAERGILLRSEIRLVGFDDVDEPARAGVSIGGSR